MTWYDNDYGYKKKITIDHTKVNGDEIDFPILISVIDNDLRDTGNGGHVQSSNGYDILFTNSSETIQFKHEIERYVNTNGLLVFWVKATSLSSTVDTELYIYYGKSGVVVNPSDSDTWDSNFLHILHMRDSTTSTIWDSVTEGTYAKKAANQPLENTSDASAGYCQDWGSATEYYIDTIEEFIARGSKTIEVWLDSSVDKTIQVMLDNCNGGGSSQKGTIVTFNGSDGRWGMAIGKGTAGTYLLQVNEKVPLPDWTYATFTWDGTTDADKAILYANATVEQTATALTTETLAPSEDCIIGAASDDLTDRNAAGYMDEIRISDIARSATWISTTYNTQDDPGAFMSFGPEQIDLIIFTPSDTFNILDDAVFKDIVSLSDDLSITDEKLFDMTDECTSLFKLDSDSYTIYLPMPIYGGEAGSIDNELMLFNFWSEARSVDTVGINTEPITIGGTIYACGDDNQLEMESIAVRLLYIHDIMDNHENVTITGLGDCFDAVYIIKDFRYGTVRGSPYELTWQLTLEYVRAI